MLKTMSTQKKIMKITRGPQGPQGIQEPVGPHGPRGPPGSCNCDVGAGVVSRGMSFDDRTRIFIDPETGGTFKFSTSSTDITAGSVVTFNNDTSGTYGSRVKAVKYGGSTSTDSLEGDSNSTFGTASENDGHFTTVDAVAKGVDDYLYVAVLHSGHCNTSTTLSITVGGVATDFKNSNKWTGGYSSIIVLCKLDSNLACVAATKIDSGVDTDEARQLNLTMHTDFSGSNPMIFLAGAFKGALRHGDHSWTSASDGGEYSSFVARFDDESNTFSHKWTTVLELTQNASLTTSAVFTNISTTIETIYDQAPRFTNIATNSSGTNLFVGANFLLTQNVASSLFVRPTGASLQIWDKGNNVLSAQNPFPAISTGTYWKGAVMKLDTTAGVMDVTSMVYAATDLEPVSESSTVSWQVTDMIVETTNDNIFMAGWLKYYVTSTNKTFYVKEGAGSYVTLTLTEGAYDIDGFVTHLTAVINASTSLSYTYTGAFSRTTNKISLTTTGDWTLKTTADSPCDYMGFPLATTTETASTTYVVTSVNAVAPITSLFDTYDSIFLTRLDNLDFDDTTSTDIHKMDFNGTMSTAPTDRTGPFLTVDTSTYGFCVGVVGGTSVSPTIGYYPGSGSTVSHKGLTYTNIAYNGYVAMIADIGPSNHTNWSSMTQAQKDSYLLTNNAQYSSGATHFNYTFHPTDIKIDSENNHFVSGFLRKINGTETSGQPKPTSGIAIHYTTNATTYYTMVSTVENAEAAILIGYRTASNTTVVPTKADYMSNIVLDQATTETTALHIRCGPIVFNSDTTRITLIMHYAGSTTYTKSGSTVTISGCSSSGKLYKGSRGGVVKIANLSIDIVDQLFGLAKAAPSSNVVEVYLHGNIIQNAALSLSPGRNYYVSSSDGSLTTTSTSNKLIGFAMGADQLLLYNIGTS